MSHTYVLERARRRKLERIFKRTRSAQDKSNLTFQRHRCAVTLDEERRTYYSSIIQSNEKDQKTLFSSMKKLLDNQSNSKSLPIFEDPLAMSNDFNSFFVKKIAGIRESIMTNNTECMLPANHEREPLGSPLQLFGRNIYDTEALYY